MSLTVKQWRLAKGISQDRMAEICGVNRKTYAAWEGNPEDISIKNALIICNALGEPFNDVFFDPDAPQNVVNR